MFTSDLYAQYVAPYDVDVGQQGLSDALIALGTGLLGNNPQYLYVLGLALAHSLPTLVINGVHYVLELVFGQAALEKYRWQPGRHPPVDLVRRCVVYVALFHALVLIVPYVLFDRALAYHPGLFTDPVPGVLTIVGQLVVAYACTDFLFYWGHRALHTPYLYRLVHKQHHQFYVTIGLAAEYAHPLELIVGNIVPVAFAAVAFKYHVFVMCLWILIAMMGTTFQHSGYGLPLSWSNNEFHDFHHSHVVCNFGSMPFWDWLLGTDRAWQMYQRTKKKHRGSAMTKATLMHDGASNSAVGDGAAVSRRARSPSPSAKQHNKAVGGRKKRSPSR